MQEAPIMKMPALRLNPQLDPEALASQFAISNRVQIKNFLADDIAGWLCNHVQQRQDWRQVLNSGEKFFELTREARAAMTAAQTEALDRAVYNSAGSGFQYRYETLRIPDEAKARRSSRDPLFALAEWMSGGEARDFLRQVTGFADVMFADAQATAYGAGDFLTAHDDAVSGKHRLAAYVLNLTPAWRTEWGGLLLFHGDGSSIADGFVPAYNVLNIFAVPQIHSVSEVSRAATARRYSVTGWLRSKRP